MKAQESEISEMGKAKLDMDKRLIELSHTSEQLRYTIFMIHVILQIFSTHILFEENQMVHFGWVGVLTKYSPKTFTMSCRQQNQCWIAETSKVCLH